MDVALQTALSAFEHELANQLRDQHMIFGVRAGVLLFAGHLRSGKSL